MANKENNDENNVEKKVRDLFGKIDTNTDLILETQKLYDIGFEMLMEANKEVQDAYEQLEQIKKKG